MISPEHTKLLTDFALAFTSGAAAGLVAGWVLLLMQIRRTLSLDDTPKLLNMIQGLEDARDNLVIAPEFGALKSKASGNQDDGIEVLRAMAGAYSAIRKLASQARHLRSNRLSDLRAYLIVGLQRSDLSAVDDHETMVKNLDKLINDIYRHLRTSRRSYLIARTVWRLFLGPRQTVKMYLRNRLSAEEKELINRGTEEYASVALLETEFGETVAAYGKSGTTIFNDNPERYVTALKDLAQRGLLNKKQSATYVLSQDGWQRAVALDKRKFAEALDLS